MTTLTALNTLTGATTAAQTSSLIVQGDFSAAFELVQGTKITSNILLGGGGILQDASVNSMASNSVIVDLNGTLNGNFLIYSAISGVGAGMTGIQTLGGIHSCASDTGIPSGFTCPISSGGSFVNAGSISLIGISFPNSAAAIRRPALRSSSAAVLTVVSSIPVRVPPQTLAQR